MKTLSVLEKKINALIDIAKTLKEENAELRKGSEALKSKIKENQELKTENAKIAEENAQLNQQLKSIETTAVKGGKELKKLHDEQEKTKHAVDELLNIIQGIDALVEGEKQQ